MVLPPELEYYIFETTAFLHPQELPNLLCVARRVLKWLEPIPYRALRIANNRSSHALLLSFHNQKRPASFFHSAVRHVLFDSARCWKQHDAHDFLRQCTGVENFGATLPYTSPALLPILDTLPHLRRLAISFEDLFGALSQVELSRYAVFGRITHLDVFDHVESPAMERRMAQQLGTLPALTHLSVHYRSTWAFLDALLGECVGLEVLLMLWPARLRVEARAFAEDAPAHRPDYDRFAVGLYQCYWNQWYNGALGTAPDLWERADKFVGRKALGAPNCWMESGVET